MRSAWIAVASAVALFLNGTSVAKPPQPVLWGFSGGADGNSPRGDLLVYSDGSLIGTASAGGATGNGSVFQVVTAGGTSTEATLWSFSGGQDGSLPTAGLISDASGALYGTAALDGNGHAGTVFQLTPPGPRSSSWTETTLWAFTGASDGGQPVSSLIFDNSGSGVLYGTTSTGGENGLGTVFSLSPPPNGTGTWVEKVIWSFSGQADGAKPVAALLQDASGALYGTTEAGGASGVGTVFQLQQAYGPGTAWSLKTLWAPSGGGDGSTPTGNLIADGAGNLYGTTKFGGGSNCPMAAWPYYDEPVHRTDAALSAPYIPLGGNGCGVVFELMPPAPGKASWTEMGVYSFTGGTDGAHPVAGLLLAGGVFYGATPEFGSPIGASERKGGFFSGSAYSLTPHQNGTFTETALPDFFVATQGKFPRGNFVTDNTEQLFCTASLGGPTWTHHSVYGYGSVLTSPR